MRLIDDVAAEELHSLAASDARIAMRALAPCGALLVSRLPAAAAARRCRAPCRAAHGDTRPLPDDAPDGLAGLRISADGELVDERGKALNALGARHALRCAAWAAAALCCAAADAARSTRSRFDVAVQAMRGAFPTGDAAASTERAPPGAVLDALVNYPCDWLFQAIARVPAEGGARDAFAAEVAAVVAGVCGEGAVLPGGISTAAKGATYVAVRVKARVGCAAHVAAVAERLRGDPRVKMSF